MGSRLEAIAAAVGGPTNLKPAEVSLQDAVFGQSVVRTLELAIEVAGRMKHDYIGTEHILLGILSDGASCSSQALLTA
jgi:ATP-dependent Clp protease ATP-binding subunit ClpA